MASFKCSKCGKPCPSAIALKKHLERKTPCDVVLNCPKCFRSFKIKASLEKHMAACAQTLAPMVLASSSAKAPIEPQEVEPPKHRSDRRIMVEGIEIYLYLLNLYDNGTVLDGKTIELLEVLTPTLLNACVAHEVNKQQQEQIKN